MIISCIIITRAATDALFFPRCLGNKVVSETGPWVEKLRCIILFSFGLSYKVSSSSLFVKI